jgi:hypothetical protein
MDIKDLGAWIAGAIIVVGIIQWVKNFIDNFKIILPSWAFSLMVPIFSVGVGFASAYAFGKELWIWNFLGTWAVAQICYESIVRVMNKKVESISSL